jgi:hypothetical protein
VEPEELERSTCKGKTFEKLYVQKGQRPEDYRAGDPSRLLLMENVRD